MPHITHLVPARSVLLVVDVQEKLIGKIHNHERIVRNIEFLIDGARLLEIEAIGTEQYPKGLGPTISPLAEKLGERPSKLTFSCCGIPELTAGFDKRGRNQIVVVGIETHVCVMNTVLDLLASGYQVYVPVDAVGSRFELDHATALARIEKAGAILTTAETTVFEWTGGANHPQFKAISALIQERMKSIV